MAFRILNHRSQTLLVAAVLLPSLLPLQAQRPAPPAGGRPGSARFERPSGPGATLHMDRPRPGGEGFGRGPAGRLDPVDRPKAGGERGPGARNVDGRGPSQRPGPVDRAHPVPNRPIPLRFTDLIATPRCTERPTVQFWRSRDLLVEIQNNARRGSIPIVPVAGDVNELKDFGLFPAGWRGYGFVVPAGGSLKVSLFHANRGWFRLQMVNKWGSLEEGMLQNVLHTFEPVVTYTNPTREVRVVYVIADDPGWMSYEQNPYTLKIERNWDPKLKLDDTPVNHGIWTAVAKEAPKPEAAPKEG